MSEHPIAANYFQVQYDEFVDNIDESCSANERTMPWKAIASTLDDAKQPGDASQN